jgi:hypothetical protein
MKMIPYESYDPDWANSHHHLVLGGVSIFGNGENTFVKNELFSQFDA